MINVDGSNPRVLYKAPDIQSFPGYPHFTPDGKSVYFSMISSAGSQPQDQKYQVLRGPADGSDWKVLLDGGYQAATSLDGARLAYLQTNAKTFTQSIWVGDANGANARKLMDDDVFAIVAGLRFSPDGQWLAFAASGPAHKALPGARIPTAAVDPCALSLLSICLLQRAYADGLPWDLWQVSLDGKTFKQLTRLGVDSPWPAFSKDGRYIAFSAVTGLHLLERATGKITVLSPEGSHGVLDWYQP